MSSVSQCRRDKRSGLEIILHHGSTEARNERDLIFTPSRQSPRAVVGMMVLIVGDLIASIVALSIAKHEGARRLADLGASRRSSRALRRTNARPLEATHRSVLKKTPFRASVLPW
jgi:hypothetical protein